MFSSIRLLLVTALLACLPAVHVHANSVGFSSPVYSPDNGQLVVTVVYDYTDYAMGGGAFDLLYDAESLEFVSYTPEPPQNGVWFTSSGSLIEPGHIAGVGHSTKFFGGINGSGDFGVFVFNVLSTPVGDPGCNGFQLCLIPDAFTPFYEITGYPVTEDLLADAHASVVSIPVPAGVWLFASGLVGLLGIRKTA